MHTSVAADSKVPEESHWDKYNGRSAYLLTWRTIHSHWARQLRAESQVKGHLINKVL